MSKTIEGKRPIHRWLILLFIVAILISKLNLFGFNAFVYSYGRQIVGAGFAMVAVLFLNAFCREIADGSAAKKL